MTILAIIPSVAAVAGFAVNELHVWRRNKNSSRDLAKAQKKPRAPKDGTRGVEYGGTKLP